MAGAHKAPRKTRKGLTCPACTHTLRPPGKSKPGVAGGEWGGLRSAPASYDLVEDSLPPDARLPEHPYQWVPIYAWVDPQPGRHLLHVIVLSHHGAPHLINLWLDDLQRIGKLCEDEAGPTVFRLTPNVRALEAWGEKGIRDGLLPKHWQPALRRGRAIPGRDFKAEGAKAPGQK